MYKHALLTGLLVVVASLLGIAAAQMNQSSQAFLAAHDQGIIDMAEVELMHQKEAAMKDVAKKISDTQKQDIKQFKKRRAEHM
jgi:uncharacterized protein (DUF305 family)